MAHKIYEGTRVNILFDEDLCFGHGACVRLAPAVFHRDIKPWVQPDERDPDAIIAAASACPSGALQVLRKDDGPPESVADICRLQLMPNGPLRVTGPFSVESEYTSPPHRAALCRCGKSERLPYCDASHERAGFTCHGKPQGRTMEQRGAEPDNVTEVVIRSVPLGPLFIEGPFEVLDEDGLAICAGREAFLCRCGHTKSAPWCDKSHHEVGFNPDQAPAPTPARVWRLIKKRWLSWRHG